MVATSERFGRDNPEVKFSWDQRPLQDFESQPLEELASEYDLLIIDYPHVGAAVNLDLLVPLDEFDQDGALAVQDANTVGPSHASYQLKGRQWALAIDAATPVSIYRPGMIGSPPNAWNSVLELAQEGRVLMPLRAPHAVIALMWASRNHGFDVARTADVFIEAHECKTALERLKRLTDLLPFSCYEQDPIAVQDAMSESADAPDYCPHAFGYVSYAQHGFRPETLRYADLPSIGGHGSRGSALGGTGIAVSASSKHQDIAAKYAWWVTSAEIQSHLYYDSGGQPGLGLAWESANCNDSSGNFFRDTRATLEGAWLRPAYDGYLDFQENASRLVSSFFRGDQGSGETADALNSMYRESRK